MACSKGEATNADCTRRDSAYAGKILGLIERTTPLTELYFLKVIVSSYVTFPSTQQQFTIGKPLSAQILLTSSHSWSDGPVADNLQMIYDIIVDKDNWLVSGTKRGMFQVTVSFARL